MDTIQGKYMKNIPNIRIRGVYVYDKEQIFGIISYSLNSFFHH